MKKDIRKIETIGLDISSSTSSNLLRILLSKKYNIKPRYITIDFTLTSAKEAIKNIDSFMLIGDNALNLKFDGLKCLDLGEEWYNWTGLPLIYAVWMARKDIKIKNLDKQLLELKEYGLNRIDEVVEESFNHYHFTKEECKEYFTNNIKYDCTEEEIKGVNLFYKFAQELKLSNPNKELKFYGED
jgi:chorismate dehydratase